MELLMIVPGTVLDGSQLARTCSAALFLDASSVRASASVAFRAVIEGLSFARPAGPPGHA